MIKRRCMVAHARTHLIRACHCSLLIFSLAIRVHLSSWPCTSSHASTRSGIWSTNWLPGSTRLLGASTQRSLVIARPGITTSAAILAASHASASSRRRHRLDVASSRGVFVMAPSSSAPAWTCSAGLVAPCFNIDVGAAAGLRCAAPAPSGCASMTSWQRRRRRLSSRASTCSVDLAAGHRPPVFIASSTSTSSGVLLYGTMAMWIG